MINPCIHSIIHLSFHLQTLMKTDRSWATSYFCSCSCSCFFSQCHNELWLVELLSVGQFIEQRQSTAIHLNMESNHAGQEIDKHSKSIKRNNKDHPLVYVSDSPATTVVSSTELARLMMCNPKTHHCLVLYNSSNDCVVTPAVVYTN